MSESKCKCSLATKLTGDGCQYCNPEYLKDHMSTEQTCPHCGAEKSKRFYTEANRYDCGTLCKGERTIVQSQVCEVAMLKREIAALKAENGRLSSSLEEMKQRADFIESGLPDCFELGEHYVWASQELTRRRAYGKYEIVQILAALKKENTELHAKLKKLKEGEDQTGDPELCEHGKDQSICMDCLPVVAEPDAEEGVR